MPKLNISLNAALPEIDNFIAACMCMASSLAGNDVDHLREPFKEWCTVAKKFTRAYGATSPFIAIANKFLKTHMEFNDTDSLELAVLLKDKMPEFQADTRISKVQLQLLKNVNTYCRKDSDAALRGMIKNVSVLRMPELSATFVQHAAAIPEGKPGAAVGEEGPKHEEALMMKIVQKLTGRINDPVLELTEVQQLREKEPLLIQKYCDARKTFTATYKRELQAFVRRSGQTMVPIQDAQAYLKSKHCDYTPQGFVGFIDDSGALYTAARRKVKGSLVGNVEMNHLYDADKDNTFVCNMVGRRERRLYTYNFVQTNKRSKFEKVRVLAKNIAKFRAKWLKDLKSNDERVQRLATIVETIYVTKARIGGKGNKAKGESTYGISTFLRKHMKVTAGVITINYPGKKGTPQPADILRSKHPVLFNLLVEAYKDADETTPVLAFNGVVLASSPVNRYLRSFGIDATIHNVRHAAATSIALDVIAKCPFSKGASQRQAEAWYKEAMKEVGDALHHQNGGKVVGTTAITSYIDPQVSQDFFTDLGLRIPDWVPTDSED